MEVKLIRKYHQIRLDELDSGAVFQVENEDGYYIATDEHEGDRRIIVDLETGVIAREKNELVVLNRSDLIITNK